MEAKNRAITKAQIEAWKKEYPNSSLHQITVPKDGKDYKAVVRKPTLENINAAEEYGKDDSLKQNLFLLKTCFLGGDDAFMNDDEIKVAASNEVARLFRFLKASIKKL